MSDQPYQPDISAPVTKATAALALLQATPLTEDGLRQARHLLAEASEIVPYLGESRYCSQARRNGRTEYCVEWRLCGRCRPLRDDEALISYEVTQ